jgi:hypothetical protein
MLRRGSFFALMALVLFAISGNAIAEPKIGIAAATKNEVQGVRGDEKRPLADGSEIFLNEAVQTGDESVAQLVFLDNTNLSVGPGSLVNLDTFIYDPNRKVGKIVVEIGRGAFRFATGPGSSRNYSLQTAHATLGIRGTIFELVSTPEELKVKLNNGLIQVRTNVGQIVWLTRPETLLIVNANGTVYGPVPYSAPITQFASLITGSTGSGGPSRTPGGASEFDFSLDVDRLNRRSFTTPNTKSSSASASNNGDEAASLFRRNLVRPAKPASAEGSRASQPISITIISATGANSHCRS